MIVQQLGNLGHQMVRRLESSGEKLLKKAEHKFFISMLGNLLLVVGIILAMGSLAFYGASFWGGYLLSPNLQMFLISVGISAGVFVLGGIAILTYGNVKSNRSVFGEKAEEIKESFSERFETFRDRPQTRTVVSILIPMIGIACGAALGRKLGKGPSIGERVHSLGEQMQQQTHSFAHKSEGIKNRVFDGIRNYYRGQLKGGFQERAIEVAVAALIPLIVNKVISEVLAAEHANSNSRPKTWRGFRAQRKQQSEAAAQTRH